MKAEPQNTMQSHKRQKSATNWVEIALLLGYLCSFYFSNILKFFASTRYENRCKICERVRKQNNNLVLVPKMLKDQKIVLGCRGIRNNLCAITKIQGDFLLVFITIKSDDNKFSSNILKLMFKWIEQYTISPVHT